MTYRALSNLEVGGMGIIADDQLPSLDKAHVFHVKKIWMMSAGEEASGGYCEVPAKKRADLMFRLERRKQSNLLKVWWHHHPINSWSSTDTSTMRERVEKFRMKGTIAWGLSFVLTPGGFIARYDQAGDGKEDNFYVDVPVFIGMTKHHHEWETHIQRMVKRYEAKSKPIKKESKPATIDLEKVAAMTMANIERQKRLELLQEIDNEPDPWQMDDNIDPAIQTLVISAARTQNGSNAFMCNQFHAPTDATVCGDCIFGTKCYRIDVQEIGDMYQQLAFA
jgi:hypothetical protein